MTGRPTPPDLVPHITIPLTEQDQEAFRLAAPLFNRIDPDDSVEWLDGAFERGTLAFKPSERQGLRQSINTLSRRLQQHLLSLETPSHYDVLRRLARRAANVEDEAATLLLSKEEREALCEAHVRGPIPNDREDGPVSWLADSVETGVLKAPQGQVRTLRVLAERLYDSVSLNARRRRLLPVQHLSQLAEKVSLAPLVMETDLRSITREPHLCETVVYIGTGDSNHPRGPHTKWLVFGQASLRLDLHPVELRAYLREGVTDLEHDSAWALVLPLVGVKLESLNYHATRLEAFIAPREADSFRVPWPGYDPMAIAETCHEGFCGEPHPIVPEEFYTPYHDPDLYKEVEGRHVFIDIGPHRTAENVQERRRSRS